MHGQIEALFRRLLAPLFVISGIIVISAFFFPQIVGEIVSGQVWLGVALVFFGSGLGYISLLPEDSVKPESDRPNNLLLIHRLSVMETGRAFVNRQDKFIFWVPMGALLVFFGTYVILPSGFFAFADSVYLFFTRDIGWIFLGVVLLSVTLCFYLLIGSWGDITLGGVDAEPTYTYPIYFTMFFTAGIAAGIVFWGPAESVFHFQNIPPFFEASHHSDDAVIGALTYSLFHWGFSAWSAYIVIGLPIAYFVYEWQAPLRVSAILTPFLGVENLDSIWAKIVDMLAIFATIGGIATSVTLVSQQFLIGINFQWGITYGIIGSLLFVGGLTAIFVISAQSGVHRGIRRISVINIFLFIFMGILIFLLGPRGFILETGAMAVRSYTINFIPLSLYAGDPWVGDWTVWNWAWWFSWAPFAGLFLAALSKGRKIRTVVFTGFFATALATMVWFLILGGTSLYIQQTGISDILGSIAAYDGSEAVAGYPLFDALPLSQLLIFLFLGLIIIFMTTSADTSTLVVSILATKHQTVPTTGAIVFWGVLQGIVAIGVLITGSAEALQTTAVLSGGPFAIISIIAILGLIATFLKHERGHDSLFRKVRIAVKNRR